MKEGTDKEEQLCIIKITENIKAIENNGLLTLPLAELKRDCRFMKFYNDFYNIKNKDKINAEKKAYLEAHPEVKANQKEYHKEYCQRPEVKAKQKEYYQRHKEEIKAKKKEYYQRHKEEIKAKQKEDNKEYRQGI